jgi:hypothetical protein
LFLAADGLGFFDDLSMLHQTLAKDSDPNIQAEDVEEEIRRKKKGESCNTC